jgi:hypothetical protein
MGGKQWRGVAPFPRSSMHGGGWLEAAHLALRRIVPSQQLFVLREEARVVLQEEVADDVVLSQQALERGEGVARNLKCVDLQTPPRQRADPHTPQPGMRWSGRLV